MTPPIRLISALATLIKSRAIGATGVRANGEAWAAIVHGGEVYVTHGNTITMADLLAAAPLDLDTLPPAHRSLLTDALATVSARPVLLGRRGRTVEVVEA